LGQGVSKSDGVVTFVAGTLPDETGTAMVYKRARGVQFARLQQLEHSADNRVESVCPHFDQCPGCQFLHTDYASELAYKKATLDLFPATSHFETLVVLKTPFDSMLAENNKQA
jgi:23S rRNA (uracil1939-C5)-methyltransferase